MSLIEIIRSDRGRKKLALEGFLYAHDRLCPDGREMWRCDRRMECKARIHTQGGRLIQRINEHTHPQDLEKIKQAKSFMDIIRLRPGDFDSGVASAISMETTNEPSLAENLADCSWMASLAGLTQIKQEELPPDGSVSSQNGVLSLPDAQFCQDGQGNSVSPQEANGIVSSSTVEPILEPSVDPVFTDPPNFWENVHSAGAFDELVAEMCGHLDRYRRTFHSRPDLRPQIAVKLSNIVGLMEISPQIKSHLQTKRLLTQAETDILHNEIRELERKASEQKRRASEAKRKAALFQQLVSPVVSTGSQEITNNGPAAKIQKPNNSRLTASAEAAHEDVTRPVVPAEAAKNVTSVFPEPEDSTASSASANEFGSV